MAAFISRSRSSRDVSSTSRAVKEAKAALASSSSWADKLCTRVARATATSSLTFSQSSWSLSPVERGGTRLSTVSMLEAKTSSTLAAGVNDMITGRKERKRERKFEISKGPEVHNLEPKWPSHFGRRLLT